MKTTIITANSSQWPKSKRPKELEHNLTFKGPLPKEAIDNRSKQLNPENEEYYKSRGIKRKMEK